MGYFLAARAVRVRHAIMAVLRCEPRAVRLMPAALVVIAVALCAWVFELGAVLEGQAEVRNWSSVWVGLDILEITGLVLTAALLARRSVYLSAAAGATAAMFALDAWFDVLMASAGADWYESVAAAVFCEIPMTVALTAIALWSAKRDRVARVTSRPAGPGAEDAGVTATAKPS